MNRSSLPRSKAQPKDLILSLATKLNFEDYARFITSARQFCPAETTDIVLLVEPMEAQYIDLANHLEVKLIPISNFSNTIHRSRVLKVAYRAWLLLLEIGAKLGFKGFEQIRRDAISAWIHPICSRHFLGRDYLATNPHYRCVLLTDSRDVIFQANPFPQTNPAVLNVFAHDASVAFGKDNIDTEWFRDIFGKQLLQKVAGLPAVCCGTTMGSAHVILTYLKAMEREILKHAFDVVDQAVHNKLVYLDLSKSFVQVHSNTSGPVLTMGDTDEAIYDVINQQVCVQGRVVPVLHQYDRVPEIKAMVDRLYSEQLQPVLN